LNSIDADAAREAIAALPGLDPEPWTATWCARAEDYAAAARRAEERGDPVAAREAWRQAYDFSFVGRYPCPSHPLKQESYTRGRARTSCARPRTTTRRSSRSRCRSTAATARAPKCASTSRARPARAARRSC
jgi:hypothetical protein